MQSAAQDDERIMTLVDRALSYPRGKRREFLTKTCGEATTTFDAAWQYVQREEQMNGFLLESLFESEESHGPFAPGEEVDGRFRIIRKVAEGGMGHVYEAYDQRLDRRIAIKCAKLGYARRLPPEARHASDISHPNICKIFEIHRTRSLGGEIDYLTMEYVEGETLSSRLRQGPIAEDEALSIARQICAGLAEAHSRRVIHGDLKAGNVMLTRNPDGSTRAVITDFGMAQRSETVGGTAQSQYRGGTPDYMAPEIWSGEKASVRSDIYALGVMLFELVTGTVPYPESRNVTWKERLTRKPPRTERWNRTIARCLEADPWERFESAEAVAQSLEPRLVRRLVAVGAVAVLVLAFLVGLYTYRQMATPAMSVRLAVVPFDGSGSAGGLAEALFRDSVRHLATIRSDARLGFRMVATAPLFGSPERITEAARRGFDATHVLRVSLQPDRDGILLQAALTEAQAGGRTKDWRMQYNNDQWHHAPVALSGFVTRSLGTVPLATAEVNPAARSDYEAGRTLLWQWHRADQALSLLERAAAADTDSPLVWGALAEALLAKFTLSGDQELLARAKESVRQAELRNQDLASVHVPAAILLQRNTMYEEALSRLQRAALLDGKSSAPHVQMAHIYIGKNEFENALASLTKAVELEPTYFRSWWELGNLHFRQGRYNEAAQCFERAVALEPEAGARLPLATAYVNLGRYAEAERETVLALQAKETSQGLFTLGKIYHYQGSDDRALIYFDKATQLSPNRMSHWLMAGICHRRLRQSKAANDCFFRALKLAETSVSRDPRNGPMRSYVAILAAELFDHQRAETEINQALQLAPGNSDVLFNAALVFEALQRREKTLEILHGASRATLEDLSRWPDMAPLTRDARFAQLRAASAPG